MKNHDDTPEIAIAKSIRQAMEAESLERGGQVYSAKERYRYARGCAREALKKFSGSHIVLQYWHDLCEQLDHRCSAARKTDS